MVEPDLSGCSVFRHVKSCFCHLSKESLDLDADGDAVVLKCGKLATRNFERVELRGNYMPHKCSRCFGPSVEAGRPAEYDEERM